MILATKNKCLLCYDIGTKTVRYSKALCRSCKESTSGEALAKLIADAGYDLV